MKRLITSTIAILFILSSCSGIEPDPIPETGTLIAHIIYDSEWPDREDIVDLRFIAFKFRPQSEADFLRITEMLVSEPLTYGVTSQTVRFEEVPNQRFYAAAIGWQYGPNIFSDWRAAGVYTTGNGEFVIEGNTVEVTIRVDFSNPPPFP